MTKLEELLTSEGTIIIPNQIIPSSTLRALESWSLVNTTRKEEVFWGRIKSFRENLEILHYFRELNNFNSLIDEGMKMYFISYPKEDEIELFNSIRYTEKILANFDRLTKESLFEMILRYGASEAEKVNNAKKKTTQIKYLKELIMFLKRNVEFFNLDDENDVLIRGQINRNISSFERVIEQLENNGNGRL